MPGLRLKKSGPRLKDTPVRFWVSRVPPGTISHTAGYSEQYSKHLSWGIFNRGHDVSMFIYGGHVCLRHRGFVITHCEHTVGTQPEFGVRISWECAAPLTFSRQNRYQAQIHNILTAHPADSWAPAVWGRNMSSEATKAHNVRTGCLVRVEKVGCLRTPFFKNRT